MISLGINVSIIVCISDRFLKNQYNPDNLKKEVHLPWNVWLTLDSYFYSLRTTNALTDIKGPSLGGDVDIKGPSFGGDVDMKGPSFGGDIGGRITFK